MEDELAALSQSDFRPKTEMRKKEPIKTTGGYISRAPDGGWGWMVVIGSFIGNFFLEGLTRSMGIVYVAMLEKFNDTATTTSLVASLYNTIFLMLGPLAEIVADRFTCRPVVIAGSIFSCVALVLAAFSNTLLQIICSYGILGGVSASFIFTPMYIMVGQYFDKKRGMAMSISTVGCGVGAIAMAPLMAYLLEEFALYGEFLIMGALMLNCAVSGMLFRPLTQSFPEDSESEKPTEKSQGKSPQNNNKTGDNKDEIHDGKQSRFFTSLVSKLSMLKDLTTLLYCLNMMSVCFCVQSVLTFLPALALEKGLSHRDAAVLLSVAGFTDIAGRFVNGVLFDFKSVRYRRRPVHSVLGIASGCTVLALGFAPSFYTLVAVIILWGLAEGGFHGQRTTIVSEIVREDQQSSAIGICIFFQGIGNLLAPVTGALFQDAFGSYTICMYYYGLVVITSSGLFLLDYIFRSKHRPKPKASEDFTMAVSA